MKCTMSLEYLYKQVGDYVIKIWLSIIIEILL